MGDFCKSEGKGSATGKCWEKFLSVQILFLWRLLIRLKLTFQIEWQKPWKFLLTGNKGIWWLDFLVIRCKALGIFQVSYSCKEYHDKSRIDNLLETTRTIAPRAKLHFKWSKIKMRYCRFLMLKWYQRYSKSRYIEQKSIEHQKNMRNTITALKYVP